MSARRVVLDRTGLIQLGGGVALLLALGFATGAVVGFAARGGAAAPVPAGARPAAVTVHQTSSAQPCVPAASAPAVSVADTLHPAAAPSTTLRATAPGRTRGGAASPAAVSERAAIARRSVQARHRYAVQVGVFAVPDNAHRLAHHLRARGYDPLVVAMRNRSGHWMRWVDLSVFRTRDQARVAAASFRAHERLPAVVVVYRGPGK